MPFRNPLRSRYAVLLGTSFTACVAAVGCNAYDDELLRRPDDGGGSQRDAAADDRATLDGAAPSDGSARDANVTDAISADAPPTTETGTSVDVAAPDGSTGDAGTTRGDATTSDSDLPDGATPDRSIGDANGTNDTSSTDAGLDATTGTRDADGAAPRPDANDAAPRDTLGGADARDGGNAAPDATTDADGGIAPPTFRVVRVGDGTAQPSAASTMVALEERDWDGQLIGRPLTLPTTASGAQQPFTLTGNAASEGALALSLDGRYLTLAGYATAPGHANVANSTDVERVVARIDAAALTDTSTVLGSAFSGSNARSAASVDGTSFWVGGASGGVWYFPLGGAGGAQIVSSPDNVRLVALYGDQLYGCSGASPMTSVFAVGTGRPTNGVQSVAVLAGMPQSGLSPYAFALFDRSAAVAGLDTLYLTDDRSPETDGSGGGIQKWTFDGSAWARVATFATVGGGTASFRGLAAFATSSAVTLVASTAETGANRLVVFVDNGSANPRGTVIASAPSSTVFRGVALAPHP